MNSIKMTALAMAGAIGLFATGCDVPEGLSSGAKTPLEMTTSALNETTFTTQAAQAQPAMAVAADRMLAVWLAKTSAGMNVVGQMFSVDGKTLSTPTVYTSTADAKTSPKVAWDGAQHFLVTYEDEYATTDHDILAFATDLNGVNTTMSPYVNYTGAYDMAPTVTFDKTINKWVVLYLERASNGTTKILGNTLDLATTSSPFTLTTSANATQLGLNVAAGNNQVLLTWRGNDMSTYNSYFMFLSGSSPSTPGTIQILTSAPNAYYPRIAYSPVISQFAAVWLDATASTGYAIHMRSFPVNCQSISCANPEKTPIWNFVSSNPSDPDTTQPVITGSDYGYYVFSGYYDSVHNQRSIMSKWVDDKGFVGTANYTTLPLCTGTCSTTPSLWAAGSMGSYNDDVYIATLPYCSNSNVIAGVHINASYQAKRFPISN